jgi:antitoxin MazE
MEAVIQRWGNDFGIRIPVGAARKMSLKTGYKVFIVPLEQKPAYKLEDLLSQVTEDNIHEEISFGKAVGNEEW